MPDIVDFHAHILPLADHGSRSVENSVKQLRLAAKHGITKIVATPHFEPQNETVDAFLRRRAHAVKLLLPYLTPDMPKIYLGAEVLLCSGMHAMPKLDKLTVAGTNVILLERPFFRLDREIALAINRIAEQGYTVLLAHIDRYDPEETRSILYPNVYAQLNSRAMRSIFARKRFLPFLRDRKVAAFGSDLHGTPSHYNRFMKLSRYFPHIFPAVMDSAAALLDGAVAINEKEAFAVHI